MTPRAAAWASAAVIGAAAANALPSVSALAPVRRLTPALRGDGQPGHVALTFDDGPDPASTPQVLEALDGLGWKATFFMLGTMARKAPSLAAEVAAAGHEIAVHGDSHTWQILRGPWAVGPDLSRAADTVARATGHAPAWYRPPYGVLAASGLVASRRRRLPVVLWGAWGRDWEAEATPETVTDTVMNGLRGGETILLHDSDVTSAPGSWRSTVAALPLLAERLAARHLQVGPLAEHGVRRSSRGGPGATS
ncbi:MAG TPA: polysaccharide deacetylase family protein [Acidimicrobiales bacterium]|nr:polysaccharide deacetylase family protein [Acidimicrobiales bacterium]